TTNGSFTFVATDIAGNISSTTVTITNIDKVAPVITLLGSNPVSIVVGTPYVEAGQTTTDNFGGSVTVVSSGSVNSNVIGTYYITYTATDEANNEASSTRTINVVAGPPFDTTAPVITLNGSSTISVIVNSSFTDPGATAIDNIDGVVAFTATGTVNIAATGTYSIVYTAEDSSHNVASTTRTVNVVAVLPTDTTAPVITLVGSSTMSLIVNSTTTFVDPGYSAFDAIDGVVTVTATGTVNIAATGTYSIVYTASDSVGNTASTTRTVNVLPVGFVDVTAPVITLVGSSTMSLIVNSTTTFVDPGYSAFDAVDGVVTVTATGTVNMSATGTYFIIYSAVDNAGNPAVATRTVDIINTPSPFDTTAPVITLNGSSTISVIVNSSFTDPGATAIDNIDGVVAVTATGTVNIAATGTYSIVYTASDSVGNTASTTRTVNVLPVGFVDVTAPVITLVGSSTISIVFSTSTSFVDPGATAIDNIDGVVEVTATGTVNMAIVGTYSIVYTAEDSSHNVASTTRIIDVVWTSFIDNIAPSIPVITTASSTGVILNSANISWSDSIDTQSGMYGYLTLWDNASSTQLSSTTAGVSTTTATSSSQSTYGTYWFHVASQDNNRNISSTTSYGPFVLSDSQVLITNSDIGGSHYTLYSPTLSQAALASTTGTTTITNSTTTVWWNIDNSVLNDSIINNSTVINSNLTRCTVIDSSVSNFTGIDCYIDPSHIENSHGDNATVINSTIIGSNYDNSNINNSYISTSTVNYSTTTYNNIVNSEIYNSVINNSTSTNSTSTDSLIDGSTLNGSTLTNASTTDSTISSSTITDSVIENSTTTGSTISASNFSNVTLTGSSTISNSTVFDLTANDLVIDGDIITNGTVTVNGTTSVITTPTPLNTLVDYTPESAFRIYPNGLEVSIIDQTSDANEGTVFPDSWTYNWNFGDGSTPTVVATSTRQNITHTYTADGTYTISLTVTDAYSKSSSTSTSVTVSSSSPDTIAPVITLNGSSTMEIIVGDVFTDPGATALDNIDGTVTVTATGTVNTSVVGIYSINYNATDLAGNHATTSVRFVNVSVAPIIPDTTAPILTLNGSSTMFIVLNSLFTDPGATAVDDIDGPITATSTGNVDNTVVGIYPILYSATDLSGNSAYQTRNVVVYDNALPQAPVITLNGSSTINMEVDTSYTDLGATAYDVTDGDLTTNIATSTNLNTSSIGVYQFTYDVSNASGTPAIQVTRNINVIAAPDRIAPIITLTGSALINVNIGGVFTDDGATALDNIDGSFIATATGTVDTNATGTYYMRYDATDVAGNRATPVFRQIIVSSDLVKPVITLTGSSLVSVVLNSTYTDAGATASDDIDGDITSRIQTNNPVNSAIAGDYYITYNVFDSAHNFADTVRRQVVVLTMPSTDHIKPIISLVGSSTITINQGSSYSDSGATAIDNVDGNLTSQIITTGLPINTSATGTYSINYNVSDRAGNAAITRTRTVTVIAVPTNFTTLVNTITAAQTLYSSSTEGTLPGQYAVGSKAILLTAINTAIIVRDNGASTQTEVDNAVSALNIAVNTFNAGVVGGDNTAPVITILGSNPISITVGSTYTDAGATALDNVDGNVTSQIVASSSVNTNATGTYSVIYTVSDAAHNTASLSRVVNVIPAVVINNTISYNAGGGGSSYNPPTTIWGDINNDGKVNEFDFSVMMADWGRTTVSLADLNKDGVVDEYDFAILMSKWTY
ncbi:MAG: immunoglobulin-like domain-containing protein, partial [Minisyncoccia bacterium]